MSDLSDVFSANPMFTAAMRAWQSMAQGSFLNYAEPILPGWTINIDSNNSSSPTMERDVLQTASYGMQLGRLGDAVAALVALQPAGARAKPPFKPFTDLQQEINDVKLRGIERRVERMAADLKRLKTMDPTTFARLGAQLSEAIVA